MGCPLFTAPEEEIIEETISAQPEIDRSNRSIGQAMQLLLGRPNQLDGSTGLPATSAAVGSRSRASNLFPVPFVNTRAGAFNTTEAPPGDQEMPDLLGADNVSAITATYQRQQTLTAFTPAPHVPLPPVLLPQDAVTHRQTSDSLPLVRHPRDNEILLAQLETMRGQIDRMMRGLVLEGRERGEEEGAVASQMDILNATGTNRRHSGTHTRSANRVLRTFDNPNRIPLPDSIEARLHDPTFPDFPHITNNTLMLNDYQVGEAPDSHAVDRTATPPVRSAAPSPPLTRHIRARHGADIHQHHPFCLCIDCWDAGR